MTKPADPVYLSFPVTLSESTDEDGTPRREISGLATTDEVFTRRSWQFDTTKMVIDLDGVEFRDKTFLAYGHDLGYGGVPIGRVLTHETVEGGIRITARLAKTAKADEVYALMQPDDDGVAVLDRFSIGFYVLGQEIDPDDPELLHLTRIEVFETSVVPVPQLDGAAVESVLSHQKETPMPAPVEAPASAADVETLSASVDTLTRKIETLAHVAPGDERRKAPTDTYGDLIKLAAEGEPDAMEFLAYAGGVTGDVSDYIKDAWVGDLLRLVEAPRKTINAFRRAPLPDEGMNVEWGKVVPEGNTTSVTKQATEGADLAVGKISLGTDKSAIGTYGGAGSLSIQQIKRMPGSMIETLFRALVIKYAATTEGVARLLATGTSASTALTGVTLTADNADSWIDFLVDGALKLEEGGRVPDFLYLSGDVFKILAKLRDGDNGDAARMLGRHSGSVNVKGLSGEVHNIPVVPVSGTGIVRLACADSITTWESGGAPFRLQQDQILNLTGDFAVYGFMANAPTDPTAALRPATFQATAP